MDGPAVLPFERRDNVRGGEDGEGEQGGVGPEQGAGERPRFHQAMAGGMSPHPETGGDDMGDGDGARVPERRDGDAPARVPDPERHPVGETEPSAELGASMLHPFHGDPVVGDEGQEGQQAPAHFQL